MTRGVLLGSFVGGTRAVPFDAAVAGEYGPGDDILFREIRAALTKLEQLRRQ